MKPLLGWCIANRPQKTTFMFVKPSTLSSIELFLIKCLAAGVCNTLYNDIFWYSILFCSHFVIIIYCNQSNVFDEYSLEGSFQQPSVFRDAQVTDLDSAQWIRHESGGHFASPPNLLLHWSTCRTKVSRSFTPVMDAPKARSS